MYISCKNRLFRVLMLLCLPLAIYGCGGSSSKVTTTTTAADPEFNGVAMAGPINKAKVQVYLMKPNGSKGTLVYTGESGTDGKFKFKVPTAFASLPFIVTVTGQAGSTYISENSGATVPFTSKDTFNAAVSIAQPAQQFTVSPLTEAAFQKIPQIIVDKGGADTNTKLVESINAANTRVGSLFNVPDILAPPTETAYVAALTLLDKMVINSGLDSTSGVISQLGAAVGDTSSPAYTSFVVALNTAADQVKTSSPELVISITAIENRLPVDTPPPEVDLSDKTAPSVPGSLSAVTTTLSSTTSSVALSWGASTDAVGVTGYQVFRDGTKIATVSTTGYTDPSVTTNVTYSYTVKASDAAGNVSAASSALQVKSNQPSLGVTVSGSVNTGNLPSQDIYPPTPPTALSALTTSISSSNSSVSLSWSAATDNLAVTGYEIFRNGTKIGTATATSYTDPSVTSAVAYSYTVKAFDAAGNRSAASTPLSVTANQVSLGVTVSGSVNVVNLPSSDIYPPTAPTSLAALTSALSASTSSVTLSWSASSDNVAVTGYEVFRNGSKIGNATTTSFTDTSVASSTAYSYTVKAFDAAGNRSAASSALSVTPNQASLGVTVSGQVNSGSLPTIDAYPPTAPTALAAAARAISATNSSVTFYWVASTDNVAVTGYDVYRDGTKVGTVSTNGYTDPSVTSNVTYSYSVIAFDAAGNRSAASTPLSVKPNQATLGVSVSGVVNGGNSPSSDIYPPTAPTGLAAVTAAVSAADSSVGLSWSTASDNVAVTGYEVFRNGAKIGTSSGTTYSDASVTSNVTYSYTVKAFDAAGNRSASSTPLSVLPNMASLGVTIAGQVNGGSLPSLDIYPPSAPTGLAAVTAAISASNSSVTLSWGATTDNVAVTGYEVFRNGVKAGVTTGTAYSDASVASNVTYAYTVKAFDAAGNRSAESTSLSVTPNQASLGVTVSGQVTP